jgi:hypothetical protein
MPGAPRRPASARLDPAHPEASARLAAAQGVNALRAGGEGGALQQGRGGDVLPAGGAAAEASVRHRPAHAGGVGSREHIERRAEGRQLVGREVFDGPSEAAQGAA